MNVANLTEMATIHGLTVGGAPDGGLGMVLTW